jgi:3'-phosphoadenosine 5'-phosphosulfate sulfotransferase (PAPS reductase)/FAD synthetase
MQELSEIIKQHKKVVVSCSFGKDSLVVLHMVKSITDNFDVVFNNTLVEYPDTLRLKRQLTRDWDLNLIEVKPKDDWSFWKVVQLYGFPVGGRTNGPTQKCCYYLKKSPMKTTLKKHKWDLVIDGITIYESRQRLLNIKQPYRYNDHWGCYKLSPIWDWTPSDVWDYIEKHGLPYNTYYDKELEADKRWTKRGIKYRGFYRSLRVGCWSCTIPLKYDSNYLIHLRTFYPKLHYLLLKRGVSQYLLDNGKNTELYQNLGADWIAENRPCYFDGVVVS